MNEEKLKRIEKRLKHVRGQRCGTCGYQPGGRVRYVVHWRTYDDPGPPVQNEYCPECGRQTVFVVTWGDWADEDNGGGECP